MSAFRKSLRQDSSLESTTPISIVSTPLNIYFCREFTLNDNADSSKKKRHTLMLIERVSQYRSIDLKTFGERYLLTNRKLEIVELLLAGLVNKEIAARLSVSEDTIKAHLRQIMKLLGVNTRTGILSVLLQQ